MVDRIEPLTVDDKPDGIARLNGREIEIYADGDFPSATGKLATCAEHMRDGRGDELVGDYWVDGFVLPRENDDPLVRYRLKCSGCSWLGKCGLRLSQYDRQGNKVN